MAVNRELYNYFVYRKKEIVETVALKGMSTSYLSFQGSKICNDEEAKDFRNRSGR